MIINLIIFFLGGLIVGSFLNVVIARIENLKSIWLSRSRCPKCNTQLRWYDLVPLLSYTLLSGRCRYCQEKISWQYPIVELSTGITFAILYLWSGSILSTLFYSVIFSLLIIVFVYDLKFQLVPDLFVWIAILLSLAGGWYFGGLSVGNMILGGVLGALPLFLLVFLSKEKWMGSGDVKLGALIGLLTGFPNVIFWLFLAFVLGSVVGLLFIVWQKGRITKRSLNTAIPFAPFLIISLFATLIFGNQIINWYLGFYL
jgi:leader peptidase (prepilin peptidase)/N-methyltransferase